MAQRRIVACVLWWLGCGETAAPVNEPGPFVPSGMDVGVADASVGQPDDEDADPPTPSEDEPDDSSPPASEPAEDAGTHVPDASVPPATPPLLPDVSDFDEDGPFAVEVSRGGPADAFTLFVPEPLGGATRHPILTWGNGTGARPSSYQQLLTHLASHGFVVIASNSTQTGSGVAMLEGVDFLLAESARSGSPFFGALDPAAIGALGHSQGGGGALNAANDARVRTTCAIQPAPGDLDLHGPLLILGGGQDSIVSVERLVRPLVFERTRGPTILAVLESASHFEPVGDGGLMRGPITAWMRLHLAGDEGARALFEGEDCTLCRDDAWTVERRNF